MKKLITIAEAAAQLGRHKSTITRAVKKLGVGQRIGQQIALTTRDVAVIRKVVRDAPGNPNFRKPANKS